MLSTLKFLRNAAENVNHPVYAQYVNSNGSVLRTCNDANYMEIAYKAPWKGSVNIFILIDILSKLTEEVEFVDSENDLHIQSGRFKSDLIIANMQFPTFLQPEMESSIKLDNDLVEVLKQGIKYVGKGNLSPLYIDAHGICVTDGARMFIHNHKFDLPKPISMNTKVLSILGEENKITSDKFGNIVVGYLGGFGKFRTDPVDFYPIDKIREFVKHSSENIEKLCNVATLLDSVEKLSPVLYGESNTFISILNNNKTLRIQAESLVNGSAELIFTSELQTTFSMNLDLKFLKGITFDFDVFINKDRQDRLYLKNNTGSEIVLMGASE